MRAIERKTKQGNFGKDQKVYKDNGLLKCTRCRQITQWGKCPKCDEIFELGFDNRGVRQCDDCQGTIEWGEDGFTLFEFADGHKEVTCESCSAVRLDKKIDQGDLLQAEDGSWFDPELFPELRDKLQEQLYQDLLDTLILEDPQGTPEDHPTWATDEQQDKLWTKKWGFTPEGERNCDDCQELIVATGGQSSFAVYAVKGKVKIVCSRCAADRVEEAVIANELFKCAYCGITDSIGKLANEQAGVLQCTSCAEKHAAATYTPIGRFREDT